MWDGSDGRGRLSSWNSWLSPRRCRWGEADPVQRTGRAVLTGHGEEDEEAAEEAAPALTFQDLQTNRPGGFTTVSDDVGPPTLNRRA